MLHITQKKTESENQTPFGFNLYACDKVDKLKGKDIGEKLDYCVADERNDSAEIEEVIKVFSFGSAIIVKGECLCIHDTADTDDFCSDVASDFVGIIVKVD